MSVDLAPGIRGAWRVGGGLLCAALLVAWPVHAIAQEPAPDRKDQIASNSVEHCKANLNRIFEAIVEYRRVYETWPKILSDLHPEFIQT